MKNKKLKIVYEDKYIIVVNKPPKLLTVSTLKEKEATLYHEVRLYKKRKKITIFYITWYYIIFIYSFLSI